jgi:hypothetical protein
MQQASTRTASREGVQQQQQQQQQVLVVMILITRAMGAKEQTRGMQASRKDVQHQAPTM